MTGKLFDREDFKQREVKSLMDISSILNNHGYNMQEKGNLENYFSVTDIKSDEDDLKNLLLTIIKRFIN